MRWNESIEAILKELYALRSPKRQRIALALVRLAPRRRRAWIMNRTAFLEDCEAALQADAARTKKRARHGLL